MTSITHPRSVNGRVFLARSGLGLGFAAVALGVFGPFGSYLSMPLPERLLFHAINVVAIGGGISLLLFALRRRFYPHGLPFWLPLAIAAAAALPGTAVVHTNLRLLAPRSLDFVSWPELVGQNLALNLALALVFTLVLRRAGATAAPVSGNAVSPRHAAPTTQHALAGRLPPHLKEARLLALEAEDHYLRIHTEAGSALILMRLSDAARALGSSAGQQVHRSFWVAGSAIAGTQRRDGRLFLRLVNGMEIPVSRSHREALMRKLGRETGPAQAALEADTRAGLR
jgi:hypothetical protein